MRKSNLAIVVVIVVVLVALGAFIFGKSSKPKTSSSSTTNSSSASSNATPTNTSNSPSSTGSQSTANVITYNGSSFNPAKLTVKSGDSVTIKNTSSKDVQFDSNPHPLHTDDQDLNVGVVAGGQSQTFTVTKKGTFGYHNHLDSSQTGMLVIE